MPDNHIMPAATVNWLTGVDLDGLITRNADAATRAAFIGVYAVDTLPVRLPNLPALLIVNSDTSNLDGQHWRAIHVDCNRRGEIFDSLAVPISPLLEAWINRVTDKWTWSESAIQNPFIPSCGAFVLHFILHRLRATDLLNYRRTYYTDVISLDNEIFIRRFVRTLKK